MVRAEMVLKALFRPKIPLRSYLQRHFLALHTRLVHRLIDGNPCGTGPPYAGKSDVTYCYMKRKGVMMVVWEAVANELEHFLAPPFRSHPIRQLFSNMLCLCDC